LFDLAGITCGHFGIPFWTFFGATLIGKSIIKVHIQAIFVIISFSKQHIEHILSIIESNLPFLHGTLSSALQKQKKSLFHGDAANLDESKPLIAKLWEGFIILMVLYFLNSIINSLVNERLAEKEKALKQK
jgi:vacuole membrane protein 1